MVGDRDLLTNGASLFDFRSAGILPASEVFITNEKWDMPLTNGLLAVLFI
jgi:hypothetical protein